MNFQKHSLKRVFYMILFFFLGAISGFYYARKDFIVYKIPKPYGQKSTQVVPSDDPLYGLNFPRYYALLWEMENNGTNKMRSTLNFFLDCDLYDAYFRRAALAPEQRKEMDTGLRWIANWRKNHPRNASYDWPEGFATNQRDKALSYMSNMHGTVETLLNSVGEAD